MKIGILYICIGEYSIFWEKFYTSCEQLFLPDIEKEYFVFSDAENVTFGDINTNIHLIHTENMGWPFNTLKRFQLFVNAKERFEDVDYLLFFNANIIFKKKINEMFLPVSEELLVVRHPGYINNTVRQYPYERRKKSLAYIPYGKGKDYVQGALIGGKTKAYLKMSQELCDAIETDLKHNIVAKWHDESFLNKYILDRNDVKIMGNEYLYAPGYGNENEAYILQLDKKDFVDVSVVKNLKEMSFFEKVINRARKLVFERR